jgi:peptide/nickel transport system permease protein
MEYALKKLWPMIVARGAQSLGVILLLTFIVFALGNFAGGDLATQLQVNGRLSDQTAAEMRRTYGLDTPFGERYLNWLGATARGNLGHSLYFQSPVGGLIWPRLGRTALIAILAFVFSWIFSLALGLASVRHPGSRTDRIAEAIVLFASSTPRLVVALAALALVVRAPWFGNLEATGDAPPLFPRALLPSLVLSVPLIALFLAQTRAAVGKMIASEHVRAARAKGLPENSILLRHVLRPSLVPLIATAGYALGATLGGSVVVEKVLSWPGIGQLTIIAVGNRDLPLLLGIVLVTAAVVLGGNLLADILMRLSDPRLRDGR